MKFNEHILKHFEKPRNVGTLDVDNPSVGTGIAGTQRNGDVVQMQILVGEQGLIKEAKFKAFGQVATIAASSRVTEWLKEKSLEVASQITGAQIAELLDLSSLKIHCALLVEDAVKASIDDYRSKHHNDASK